MAQAKQRGVYLYDWQALARYVKDEAGNKCVRCGHVHCRETGHVLTVHHFDGDKCNNARHNLLALCQRCRLSVQARVRQVVQRPRNQLARFIRARRIRRQRMAAMGTRLSACRLMWRIRSNMKTEIVTRNEAWKKKRSKKISGTAQPIEHPDDKAAREKAEASAARLIDGFMAKLDAGRVRAMVLAYPDADAVDLLAKIREEFWTSVWQG